MDFLNPNSKLSSIIHSIKANKKIIGIFSSDLFWILIIGGLFRLVYYSFFLPTKSPDTNSYINAYPNILKGNVDVLRTPLYPYFIKFISLFGKENLIRNIVAAQSLISYLTIIPFYKIAKTIYKTKGVTRASTLLYATMLPVINFDTIVATESLSVCFMVMFIMLVVTYLKRQTSIKAIFLTFSTFIAIMLRPAYLFLLPLIIIFWVLRLTRYKKEKKQCILGLACSFFTVLLLHGYCSLNEKQNGLYGISSVSNINQLDIIIISNMYSKGDDTALSNLIGNYFSKPLLHDEHWYLLEKIISENKPIRITNFITNCFKNQPSLFVKRIVRTTMALQTKNIFVVGYAAKKEGLLPRLVSDFQFFVFYTTFNKLFLFLFFDAIFLFFWRVKTKETLWLSICLWLVVVAQIAVAIIGAQSDYQRLILAAIPCLIIMLFSYIDRIGYAVDLKKIKSYPAFGR